jgi:hypothetical protein
MQPPRRTQACACVPLLNAGIRKDIQDPCYAGDYRWVRWDMRRSCARRSVLALVGEAPILRRPNLDARRLFLNIEAEADVAELVDARDLKFFRSHVFAAQSCTTSSKSEMKTDGNQSDLHNGFTPSML